MEHDVEGINVNFSRFDFRAIRCNHLILWLKMWAQCPRSWSQEGGTMVRTLLYLAVKIVLYSKGHLVVVLMDFRLSHP